MRTISLFLAAGVAALAAGCATVSTPSVTADQLAGSSWHVSGLNAGSVQTRRMTISFDESGRVTGNAACNDYRAVYEMRGRRLRFGKSVILTTDRFCDLDTVETEERFIATLGEVRSVSIAPSGSLVLHGDAGMRIVARRI